MQIALLANGQVIHAPAVGVQRVHPQFALGLESPLLGFDELCHCAELALKGQCLQFLCFTQIAISRAQCQPVLASFNGTAQDLNGHGHLPHHLLKNFPLLEIFFAKDGRAWIDHVKELHDHGANTSEKTRPEMALP